MTDTPPELPAVPASVTDDVVLTKVLSPFGADGVFVVAGVRLTVRCIAPRASALLGVAPGDQLPDVLRSEVAELVADASEDVAAVLVCAGRRPGQWLQFAAVLDGDDAVVAVKELSARAAAGHLGASASARRVGEMVVAVDRRGRCRWASHSALAFFGLSGAQELDGAISRFRGSAEADWLDQLWTEGRLDPPVRLVEIADVEGEPRWLELAAEEIDGFDGLVIVARDVTAAQVADVANSELAAALARQVDELAEVRADLTSAMNALNAVREAERRDLAVQMHDDTLPLLVGARWMVEEMVGAAPGRRASLAGTLVRHIDAATASLRRLLSDLHPLVLDSGGVIPAISQRLRHLRDAAGVRVELHDAGVPRLAVDLERTVFRTVREALRNVAEHARAEHVIVALDVVDDDILEVRVSDDGVGVDLGSLAAKSREDHIGVLSMRHAIEGLGGTFSITRRPGGGTEVLFRVPVELASTS